MKVEQKYIIKNMVCQRCIEVVEEIFKASGFSNINIELGKVSALINLEGYEPELLKKELENRGFEIVKSSEERLLESTKVAIIKLIHYLDENPYVKNSVWLEAELDESYQKISRNFSSLTDTTIEKFIIKQKIEKAKELILYNELNFEDIALKLGYRSISHLSTQFKTEVGLSLTEYKKQGENIRNKLEDL